MDTKKIIVVGAGPAGIMAAIRSSQLGQEVTLVEKNSILGKKLLLSGKGRCNLTNFCELDLFLKRFSGNGQFLRDAFKKFFNSDLMEFFERRGLKLKVERQERVFPETNLSASVAGALEKELLQNKVKILYKAQAQDIKIEDGLAQGIILINGEFIPGDKVILATGGLSYKFTGSTGEGLDLAKKLKHEIVPPRAGLVPLEIKEKYPQKLEGLVLKNIVLEFSDGKRKIVSDIGELLFTSFGISGPLVLSLSGRIVDWLIEKKDVSVGIDLKPALSEEQLNNRLIREFKAAPKKSIKNTLKSLLPLSLIDVFLEVVKIDPWKTVSHISVDERKRIVRILKDFRLNIKCALPLENAMVTQGGVALKDINPRTMESRKIKGLYFCGEMIDLDADTGGFNLQAAFSTGYLAGESAAA
ncbi:MAG: NAD(P)/FAD-dependent oxidoreductase [Candidatus Omnitrophota bacterium]